jgi:succinoglycan biosynthesis transport protein ExoP
MGILARRLVGQGCPTYFPKSVVLFKLSYLSLRKPIVSQQSEETFDMGSTGGDSGFGVAGILGIAWRRKSLIILGGVVGLIIGALYYSRQPAVYQSSASVLIIKKQQDAMPAQGVDAGSKFMEDYLMTHLIILKSPAIADLALKKGQLGKLKSLAGVGDPQAVIMGSLTVSRDTQGTSGSTSILNLSYKGPIPEDCAVILAAVVESYKDFLDKTYRNVNEDTVSLIEKAKDILHNDMSKDLVKLEAIRKDNPLMVIDEKGNNPQQQRLSELDQKRFELQMKVAEMETRLTAIKEMIGRGEDPAPYIQLALKTDSGNGGKGETSSGSNVLWDLSLKEQELLEFYGAEHPEVKILRKRIGWIQNLQNNMKAKVAEASKEGANQEQTTSAEAVKSAIRQIEGEIASLNLSEKVLSDLLNQEKKTWNEIGGAIGEQQELLKKIDHERQLYEETLKRIREMDLVKDFGGYDSKVLSGPAPGLQIEPRATPIFLMALMGGLLGGFGLAWVAEMADKSFRTPEEIRRRLGLPIIGHVAFLTPDEATIQEAAEENCPLDVSLCTYYKPRSVQAEAFRGLRTSLYFSTSDKPHKVLQVTSPNKGDGKSTVAANLAISIAQSGKTVLLIDADFRRPRQHKLFGMAGETGMSTVLLGEAELKEAIQPTRISQLSILPCGPRPNNPAELLTSQGFQELLAAVRDQYEFVIVDTPPVLVVSDPSVVAPRVDGVLLTIRVSKNGRPDAERAKEMLVTLGANIVGVIVNGIGGQKNYGYNQYYNYRYGYNYQYNYSYYKDADGYYEDTEGEENTSTPEQMEGEEDLDPDADQVAPARTVEARSRDGGIPSQESVSQRHRSSKRVRIPPKGGIWHWLRGWWG